MVRKIGLLLVVCLLVTALSGCSATDTASAAEAADLVADALDDQSDAVQAASETVEAISSASDGLDLAAVAETLGISEDALTAALGDIQIDGSAGEPDYEAAAEALGIAAEALQDAMSALLGEEDTAASVSANSVESLTSSTATISVAYPVVETGQGFCYDDDGNRIDCPAEGEAFYGQDAQFTGYDFSFTDNGDGTVTDNVTGLVWQQTPDTNTRSWYEAIEYCNALELGGRDDWRMPTLKELYSIANFSAGWPYLDLDYFDLVNNDSISKDEQYWGNSHYVGTTAEGQYDAAFGVNAATGHIKAYPASVTGPMAKYVRAVAGDVYGENDLVDNGDGTISDNATGLMWSQADSNGGMEWEEALAYAQEMNAASYLGYSDWRLPNVKELQSIADYDYAPDAQDAAYDGPALDPMFTVSTIINEAGQEDYPYYWTSTSARFQSTGDFFYAWYVAAGRAVDGNGNDSHGAGAVRFDTKAEDGPAGEGGERYYNYVRLVRGGEVTETPDGDPDANDTAPELEFTGAGGPPQGAPPQRPESETDAEQPADAEQSASAEQPAERPEPPQRPEGDDAEQRPEPPTAGEGEIEQQSENGQPLMGGRGGGMGGQQIDLETAAANLGVTEEALTAALGTNVPPDFEAAAETLGVTVDELMAALGMDGDMPAGGPPTGGRPAGQ